MIALSEPDEFLQIRGEIIHQSESINRYIRYPVLGILNTSWHTHYQVRGFTNYGESMGAGVGVGSNAQILELSKVKQADKFGIIAQRIENNADFFMRARDLNPGMKPWIDFSLGLIWEKRINNLIVSSTLQAVHGLNYQWQTNKNYVPDFSGGTSLSSFSGKMHLIYLLSKN